MNFATAKLKSAGLRITQPRLAILGALSRFDQPASIEVLHEALGSTGCDLVTVYRCMAAFEQIGLVRRTFFHDGTALYEISLGQPVRYHVVCKSTKRVEELDAETSDELRQTLGTIEENLRARGYADVGHMVEFFGIAPQSKRTSSAVPLLKR